MVTSLSHAQQGKYFSNPVSETLGNILLISFVQNVYLCAFTNCLPGPRNLCNFNEGALSIFFSFIVFSQIAKKKNSETVNTLIISICKNLLLWCSFGCCFINYKHWKSSCGKYPLLLLPVYGHDPRFHNPDAKWTLGKGRNYLNKIFKKKLFKLKNPHQSKALILKRTFRYI